MIIEKNHNALSPPTGVSPEDLFLWGMAGVAYVKPMDLDNGRYYGVFTAAGGPITYTLTLDEAMREARKRDLEPLVAH